MPAQQEEFQNSVQELLEVAMFENWLRFYFIREMESPEQDKPELIIKLPEKTIERIKENYPPLYPLAKNLNNQPINFETSKNAVLTHILQEIEGKKLAKGVALQILQSHTFQIKLELFHTWEQMHEDQLESGFMDFATWCKLFSQWLESEGAKELTKRLMQKG